MATVTELKPSLTDKQPLPRGTACGTCGAPLEPLDKFCNACGVHQTPEVQPAEIAEQKRFRCENCGSEVRVDPSQRSYTCPFCDSNYVVELPTEETGRQRPEFVIGFSVTPEQALEKFRSWIKDNGWFRPGDLHRARIEDKLRGIYLPFWAFSMLAQSQWSASIGEYWYRTETYTTTVNGKTVTRTRRVRETEWWPLSGRHHAYYSGYLVSGSRGLSQSDAERIKPFHLAALKRYEPYFLAGWLSEEYSVERDEALQRCEAEFYRWERDAVAAFMPGDTHSALEVQTHFSNINSDLILVPTYLLSYRYQDQIFRFFVNGQTGRIDGDKPLSKTRIAVAVTALLLLILIVVLLVNIFGR